MRRISGSIASLLLAAALVASAATSGCSARASGEIKGARAPVDTPTQQASNVQQRAGAQPGQK
jgi:hypothetical protein